MAEPIPKRAKPIRHQPHLDFVATNPCCCCGKQSGPAHHLIGDYISMGVPPRQGIKRGDNYAIPLCPPCHDQVHNSGLHGEPKEKEFLAKFSVDGLALAAKLWIESGGNDMSPERDDPKYKTPGLQKIQDHAAATREDFMDVVDGVVDGSLESEES